MNKCLVSVSHQEARLIFLGHKEGRVGFEPPLLINLLHEYESFPPPAIHRQARCEPRWLTAPRTKICSEV